MKVVIFGNNEQLQQRPSSVKVIVYIYNDDDHHQHEQKQKDLIQYRCAGLRRSTSSSFIMREKTSRPSFWNSLASVSVDIDEPIMVVLDSVLPSVVEHESLVKLMQLGYDVLGDLDSCFVTTVRTMITPIHGSQSMRTSPPFINQRLFCLPSEDDSSSL
jgi:hypothetical protein